MKNFKKLFLFTLIIGSFLSCLQADTIGKRNIQENTSSDQNEMYLRVQKLLREIKISKPCKNHKNPYECMIYRKCLYNPVTCF